MKLQDRYTFEKDTQTSSVSLYDNEYKIKAITFERTPNEAVLAYIAARYSRSSASIVDTYKTLLEDDKNLTKTPEEKLATIFHGYGHKSVADGCGLFIALENIPLYQIEVLMNLIPVISGQARSTRYQNFVVENLNNLVVNIPDDLNIHPEWISLYADVLTNQIEEFNTLYRETEEQQGTAFNIDLTVKKNIESNRVRSLDTARYLLPLGLRSSVALFINATNLAEIISQLLASSNCYNVATGNLLLQLMTNKEYDYNRQAESLIRHTEPKYKHIKIDQALKNLVLAEGFISIQDNCKSILESIIVETNSSIYNVLTHAIQLAHPRILDLNIQSDLDVEQAKRLLTDIAEIIFSNTTDKDLPGPIVQTSALGFHGLIDIGSARDLNRHRSTERFFPYLSDAYPTYVDIINSNVSSKFVVCPYLSSRPELKLLEIEYERVLAEYYYSIQSLLVEGREIYNVPEDILNEFAKYLLPMAHLVNYNIYADLKDITYIAHLRTRPGGHIAYRMIVEEWINQLAQESDFFSALMQNLPSVDPYSEEQYLDRR